MRRVRSPVFRSPAAALTVLLAVAALCAARPAPAAGDPALDYVLNCQGCHLPDGRGMAGRVPSFRGQLARFLSVPGGRAFLIQVPGVARANLSDARIAALMNWLLPRFDREHLPTDFRPYTTAEVARLRAAPEVHVAARRARLIAAIEALKKLEKSSNLSNKN